MERTSFIPEYSDTYEFVYLLSIIGEMYVLMLLVSGLNRSLSTIVIGMVLGFLVFQYFFLNIREIIFFKDHFIIVNNGSRIRKMGYSEITDIGTSAISFQKGHISLYGIKNAQELHNIMQRLIDEGIIDTTNLTNNLKRQEKMVIWMQLFIPIGLIVMSLNFYFFPFEKSIYSKLKLREDVTMYIFAFLLAGGVALFIKFRNDNRRD